MLNLYLLIIYISTLHAAPVPPRDDPFIILWNKIDSKALDLFHNIYKSTDNIYDAIDQQNQHQQDRQQKSSDQYRWLFRQQTQTRARVDALFAPLAAISHQLSHMDGKLNAIYVLI